MSQDPQSFISRWQKSGGAERANYPVFLTELSLFFSGRHLRLNNANFKYP